MLFSHRIKKYVIIDTSFIVYQGSFAKRDPCVCSVVNREGKLVGKEDCTFCDGSGRSYMSNKAGERTGGIHQVLYHILRMIDSGYKPILVFDPPKENLDRTELHDEYKGNRKETPSWIENQMNIIEQYFPYIENIDCYTSHNHESDDVIATLALELATLDSSEIIVITDDKDMFPLLSNKKILIYRQGDMFTKAKFYNKFGFMPDRFTDYLTIVGDSADNYNLIKGLGPKAAEEIIKHYKTIDEFLNDNFSKCSKRVKNKMSDLISQHGKNNVLEAFAKSAKLAQLKTDVEYQLLSPEPSCEIIIKEFKRLNLYLGINNMHKLFNLGN
jgi:5'-3' exonuclease